MSTKSPRVRSAGSIGLPSWDFTVTVLSPYWMLMPSAVCVSVKCDMLRIGPMPDISIRSTPNWKSVITSFPETCVITKVSLPAPPVIVSLPAPSTRMSFPAPPLRRSLPAPPLIRSSLALPFSVLLPAVPLIEAAMLCTSTLSCVIPASVSLVANTSSVPLARFSAKALTSSSEAALVSSKLAMCSRWPPGSNVNSCTPPSPPPATIKLRSWIVTVSNAQTPLSWTSKVPIM